MTVDNYNGDGRLFIKCNLILLIVLVLSYSVKGFTADAAQSSVLRLDKKSSTQIKTDDVGLGAKWGDLTGVNLKYWYNEEGAWDATVAFENGNTSIGIDHLWNLRTAALDLTNLGGSQRFVPYLGVGLVSAFGKDTKFFNRNTDEFGLAARSPFGLEFLPRSIRVGIFGEVALGFGFVPTTYTFITANLGARYYF